jgi:NAD(P)-dependent dehydrogenase (short-subunit alcohol dehydrogenase family)
VFLLRTRPRWRHVEPALRTDLVWRRAAGGYNPCVSTAHTRVALVTGANRGLGFETSRQLLAKGLSVVLAGRDAGALDEALRRLGQPAERAMTVTMDVTDAASIARAQQAVAARFGQVDILVNNAAVLLFEDADVLSIPADGYRQTFDTNVFGAIEVCRAFAPEMARPLRTDRERVIRSRAAGDDVDVRAGVFDVEGRAERVYQAAGAELSGSRRAGERRRSGLGPHRHGRLVRVAIAGGRRRHHRVARDAA